MRLVVLLIFSICLSFSVAYGQTSEEKTLFVDKALNRISSKTTERETQLTAQLERLREVDEQARRNLENTVAKKARAEKSLADLAQFEKEMEHAYPSSETFKILARLEKDADEAKQRLPELEARERKEIHEAYTANNEFIQKELELRNVIARDTAIKTSLKTLDEAWRSQAANGDFIKLIGAIATATKEMAIRSSANIMSQDSSGMVTTGVRVRFQGDDERRNVITPRYSGLTGCVETNLDIGWYYFWTERNGRATSDKNYGKFIIDPVESVQLLEDK
jgi:hypothetical protein